MGTFVFTPDSIAAWIKIGQILFNSGEVVVADFKNFLADHGFDADTEKLTQIMFEDNVDAAAEDKIKNS